MQRLHLGARAGHSGRKKTLAGVRFRFVWGTMARGVEKLLGTCVGSKSEQGLEICLTKRSERLARRGGGCGPVRSRASNEKRLCSHPGGRRPLGQMVGMTALTVRYSHEFATWYSSFVEQED